MSDQDGSIDVPADAEPVEKDETAAPADARLNERLKEIGKHKKAAEERAQKLEAQLADLQSQMEERENANLPELERERKRAEALEKRIADAEARAEQAEKRVQTTQREQWIAAAAAAANFANPARAARLVDNLDGIEDPDQAERAVKRLAKSDPYLVKADSAPLPGRVLENGRQPAKNTPSDDDPKAGLGEELLTNLFGGGRG